MHGRLLPGLESKAGSIKQNYGHIIKKLVTRKQAFRQ